MDTENNIALVDLERELAVTRRLLERLPESKFEWKVHEKSMKLGRLAMHVATLPEWLRGALADDGMDMLTVKPMPTEPGNLANLLKTFDECAERARAALANLSPADLSKPWTVRRGDTVLFSGPRIVVARVWCLNHLVHHRAQLCVYLRLLGVPVPAVYFNSADEPEWTFA